VSSPRRFKLREAIERTYLTVDARSLGLFRVGLGVLLLVDLARRLPHLGTFYTNAGLLPNHTVLWRPIVPRLFSFFFPISLAPEAWLAFALCGFCYVALLVGWRTRFFQVASLLMATSLHNRVVFVENWGSVALGALQVWTVFLPLGRRFSVDAVRSDLRARRDETPADLVHERLQPPDDRPAVSLAFLGALLQLAVIYFFNYLNKSGDTWRSGVAIHYVLWQARIVTTVGLWARTHLPLALWRGLTHATLALECTAPLLVLSPVFRSWSRGFAVLVMTAFHVGIALIVNIGIFSGAMLAYFPLLLTDEHWRLLGRLVPTRGRARVVYYDAGCGVCFQIVRILARLDVHRRLTWISNQDLAALPANVPPDLLERTILVVDSNARDRRWTRSDAFAEILGALPLGRLGAWPLRLPGLSAIAGAAYDAFARNRTRISMTFGLAACGVPGAPPPARAPEPVPTPLGAWVGGRLAVAREIAVAVLMVAFAADLSVSNPAVPEPLRWDARPAWLAGLAQYPHVSQTWMMFAPDAPLRDSMVVVDALTTGGRHADPLNEVASRVSSLPLDDIPQRLGQDSFWCDYELRIAGTPAYHQALLEWILRYPERTGRADDAIVSLEVSLLEHASPPPGETKPSDLGRHVFLRWTQPPPAPPPKPASAPPAKPLPTASSTP